MAPIRIRHPAGIATIQVALDQDTFTVGDLQQEIYAVTQILPSQQNLKSGYPPQPLTLIPELPLSSLGLRSGDQIIVSASSSEANAIRGGPASPANQRSAPPSAQKRVDPAPGNPKSAPQPSGGQADHVQTDGGVLIHRIVPDDNSCLFSAVALVFKQDIAHASQMRKIVANGISKDTETYNEGILGMPPADYITTIMKPSTWGGAIELGILAAHFGSEIASIDVETGRIDHFSPPGSADTRCVLIYSGIHYDAATLAPVAEAPPEWHQTLFPVRSPDDNTDSIMVAAKKLATILRSKKAFTNTNTFDLKCEDCGQGLKGEKNAREHAAQTGHVNFGEY